MDADRPETTDSEKHQGPQPCPACGYDLRGLSRKGVCPECGVPYDLEVWHIYTRRPPFGFGLAVMPPLVAILLSPVCFAARSWVEPQIAFPLLIVYIALAWVVADLLAYWRLSRHLLACGGDNRCSPRDFLRRRRALLFLIQVLGILASWPVLVIAWRLLEALGIGGRVW